MPETKYAIELEVPEPDAPDLEQASTAIAQLIDQLNKHCRLEAEEIAYLLRTAADLLTDDDPDGLADDEGEDTDDDGDDDEDDGDRDRF